MKRILGVAALLLFFSIPAHAQASIGGSLNSGGHILQSYPMLSTALTYSVGPLDYVPTTFMCYDQAIAVGRAAATEHVKTLVEIAQDTRDREKGKGKIVFVQDADNRVIAESVR
jgi:hypothetical protein